MRVVCRFRPLAATDPRADAPADAPFELAQHSVRDHRGVGGAGARLYGRFDAVLGPASTQDECFRAACAGVARDALRGVSLGLFAYGGARAGKTHSLVGGADFDAGGAGLIPRVVAALCEARARLRAPARVELLLRC